MRSRASYLAVAAASTFLGLIGLTSSQAAPRPLADGVLVVHTEFEAGPVRRIAVTDIPAADLKVVNADGVSLAASGDSVVFMREWSQQMHGPGFASLWSERHEGSFYWDGVAVWSTSEHRGYRGYHSCDLSSEFGFGIHNTYCESTLNSTSSVTEWDIFRVSAVDENGSMSRSREMHVNVDASGFISYWWDGVKRASSKGR